jgi:hypothetical protein
VFPYFPWLGRRGEIRGTGNSLSGIASLINIGDIQKPNSLWMNEPQHEKTKKGAVCLRHP